MMMLVFVCSVSKSQEQRIVYLTDLEGNYDKWVEFQKLSGAFETRSDGTPILKPGYHFVYGGDVSDKGSGTKRILRDLVTLKENQPRVVTLIIGNRDLNKIPLLQLYGDNKFEDSLLISFVSNFLTDIGARNAIDHRKVELQTGESKSAGPIDSVKSLIEDLGPDGYLRKYLQLGVIAEVVTSSPIRSSCALRPVLTGRLRSRG